MAVCAAVSEVLDGSHATLDAVFEAAGVPGPPPNLSHHSKWKTWLFSAGNDPEVDSLAVLGNLIEEFMDLPPDDSTPEFAGWRKRRQRLVTLLEEHGFRYFRGGCVLPNGQTPLASITSGRTGAEPADVRRPSTVEELLQTLVSGLPRAMHPLTHRRKGALPLSFESEYDIQDLLHALLRPWVADIRPEEYTPSYAGSSTRMDFLLPAHSLVLETKLIRDSAHGRQVGDELIIDIEHYRRHPKCDRLWCVIYDLNHLIPNPNGLITDLEGHRTTPDGSLSVRVFVLCA